MSERDIKTTIAAASMTGGRPWAYPQGRAPVMRWNAMAWAAVALAGWSAAGLTGAMVVREHQVTNHLVALAGFTPVPGPGIEIVLTDGIPTSRPIADPNAMLV